MLEHITKEFVEDLIGCEVAAFKVDPTQVKITIKPK